jgi:hypothetical protein
MGFRNRGLVLVPAIAMVSSQDEFASADLLPGKYFGSIMEIA